MSYLSNGNRSHQSSTNSYYPRRPKSFYLAGKYRYKIYPDYWKVSWGEAPCLGIVFADNEFYAEREAYNKGLLTLNYTFGPKAVRMQDSGNS